MASINTNAAAMAAVRSLSTISRDMLTTQSRVESGLRVNKANDDPAVFAIAQNMRAGHAKGGQMRGHDTSTAVWWACGYRRHATAA